MLSFDAVFLHSYDLLIQHHKFLLRHNVLMVISEEPLLNEQRSRTSPKKSVRVSRWYSPPPNASWMLLGSSGL